MIYLLKDYTPPTLNITYFRITSYSFSCNRLDVVGLACKSRFATDKHSCGLVVPNALAALIPQESFVVLDTPHLAMQFGMPDSKIEDNGILSVRC